MLPSTCVTSLGSLFPLHCQDLAIEKELRALRGRFPELLEDFPLGHPFSLHEMFDLVTLEDFLLCFSNIVPIPQLNAPLTVSYGICIIGSLRDLVETIIYSLPGII